MKKLGIFIRKYEKNIAGASIIILILSFLTKLLGFIKIRLIATTYGASRELDIFWASFVIPDLVFMLLIGGSLNAALIPTFVKLNKKNPKQGRQVFNIVLTFTTLFWLISWFVFAWVIHTYAPVLMSGILKIFAAQSHVGKLGLIESYYANQSLLFANLSTIMFASTLLLAISSVIGAYLASCHHFTVTNLSSLMYNLGIIIALLTIKITGQINVYYLAFSIIFGSLLHLTTVLIFLVKQYPDVLKKLPKDVFFVVFKKATSILNHVKNIIKLSIPRILGLAVEHIVIIFNTFWALALKSGALSILKYALSIHFLPIQLVGTSIAQAVFPTLSGQTDIKKFTRLFIRAFLIVFLISGYLAILIYVLKFPIVYILLAGGRFTQKEVFITGLTLGALAGAVLINSLMPLIMRAFYSLHQTKTPFFISLIGVLTSILATIAFSNLFGHPQVIAALKLLMTKGDISMLMKIFKHIPTYATTLARGPFSVVGLALGISVGLIPEFIIALILLNKQVKGYLFKFMNGYAILSVSIFVTVSILAYFTNRFVKSIIFSHGGYQDVLPNLVVILIVSLISAIPIVWTTYRIYVFKKVNHQKQEFEQA